MAYEINSNEMINQINSMFGPNAYQDRMAMIDNVAKLKTQRDQALKDYNARLKDHNDLIKQQQAAAKKAATQAKKKTYVDAVDELAANPALIRKDGAYKTAEEIKNDPSLQAKIKAQGYNVSDYINALYNVASNGKYRSEREFNQYNKQLKADVKKKQSDPTYGMDVSSSSAKPQPKQSGGIGGFLGALGQDLQRGYDRLVVKPTHAVEGAVNNFLSQEKAHIDEAKKTGKSKGGISVNLDEILNAGKQGWNGNVSGYDVLNTAGIKNKTAQKIGGGALDFAMNPLNMAPYAAAESLLARAGLGAGVASRVGGGALGEIAGTATQGAAAGGLGSLPDALLNPNGGTAKDRAKEVLGMTALGGGLGGIGGFLKSISKSAPKEVSQELLALPEPQKRLPEPLKGLPEPLTINKTLAPNKAINGVKRLSTPNPYPAKFEKLVSDFNKLQSEGKVTPGREYEVAKEMWNHMAGPHDPSFENLLKLANDNTKKVYSPQEQASLLKLARKNQHAGVYGVDNLVQRLPKNPSGTMRVPLSYVGKNEQPFKQLAKPVSNEPLAQLQQTLKQAAPAREYENITAAEPKLKRMTKSDLIQEANLEQFAKNNADSTIPDTSGHIVSKKDLKTSPKGLLHLGYTKAVDNLYPLSKFDKMVEKVTGIPLKPSEKTHMLGLNSRGSDQISKQILTQNMVNSKNEVIGQSLKDITKNLNDKQLKEFEDYLINKHAITRMNRGEKVYSDDMKMSPEKSQVKVNEYEQQHPEFKQLAKEYYNYNKKLGKAWLVDTGILTKDEWKGYLENNPYYVPMNRAFDPLEKSMVNYTKSGFANQSNPVKAATGSQRKIISPLESTIEHTAQYVKTAKRNEVMQALIKNITKNPEDFKGWAEVVKTEKTPKIVLDTLNKDGVEGVLSELNKGFDQKPDLTHGNIVTGIIDGQKVHVRVHDPQLLDAITNLAPKEQHLVFRFFGQLTRFMKAVTTGFNPVFSLTRNIFRDIPTSYVNSKTVKNPAQFSKDLISAFIDVVGNKKAYQSFKNFGGGHSSPISSDVNLLAQSKRSILKQKGIRPLIGKGLGALENLNNAIESAPRLAEYKRNVVPGNYDSQVKGLYEANDITTNFNKHGNFTKGLDSLVPYLNAAVQGLDKLGRQFKDAPKQTILKASGAIALPTIVLYAANHNNPNYQQLSNYVKDNNFVIPLSDGTFYKIPKPRELGMAFSTDIERMLRSWADNDPHAFQGFVADVIGNFAPPVRTVIAPFNDIRANKNFIGAPIVPGDLQNLSPKYQYDSQTTSLAKGLGNLTNKSPKQIDYLIKSYGGVLGQIGIPALSPGSTVGSTLKNQVIADPVFSNDIMSNFYNEKNKLDMAKNDYTKQGAISPDLNESLRKAFDVQARNISKVRKELKAVQSDNTLSNKEKQDKIRRLQQIMNNIAQQTNRLAR